MLSNEGFKEDIRAALGVETDREVSELAIRNMIHESCPLGHRVEMFLPYAVVRVRVDLAEETPGLVQIRPRAGVVAPVGQDFDSDTRVRLGLGVEHVRGAVRALPLHAPTPVAGRADPVVLVAHVGCRSEPRCEQRRPRARGGDPPWQRREAPQTLAPLTNAVSTHNMSGSSPAEALQAGAAVRHPCQDGSALSRPRLHLSYRQPAACRPRGARSPRRPSSPLDFRRRGRGRLGSRSVRPGAPSKGPMASGRLAALSLLPRPFGIC